MTTRIVDKRNLRNLIDMSRQRMCNRAYWEFRELFRDICIALTNYDEEWGRIVKTQLYAKCAGLGYCPEKHGCGWMDTIATARSATGRGTGWGQEGNGDQSDLRSTDI